MPWPTQTVVSRREFTGVVDGITGVATPLSVGYLFRGQADADWSLEPSIARVLRGQSAANVMNAEKLAVEEFKMHAHLYLSSAIVTRTTDFTGWWSLMQHYRAPTRLLDWTASPYVAVYFAAEDHWSKDGAVWLFAVADLDKEMTAKYGQAQLDANQPNSLLLGPASPPQLFVVRRLENTERMIAQQGGFTLCRQPLYDHAQAIEDAFIPGTSKNWLKIIVPGKLKQEFLRRLRAMNVAVNALFPGIDGVGRSVAELLRVI